MFALPLGLQAKTRDFPWVTFSIFIVTVIYSVASFDFVESVSSVRITDPLAVQRFQKQKSLAVAACSVTEMTTEDCAFVSFVARPEKSENTLQFLNRFSASAREKKLGKSDEHRLAEYIVTPWKNVGERTAALPEYGEYRDAVTTEEANLAEHARENQILTRASFTMKSLLRAQFLHAGWMHLIGNMIFFLIFAIPLEQRVGRVAFLLIYFVGGTAGLTTELYLNKEAVRPVLGASANISAVAAAFMIAFWSFSFRVWVSMFFAFNQVVLIPTYLFLAAFVVVQDLSGVLRPDEDGVAHFAHLGGFGVGWLLGFIAVQVFWLPKGFAFPFELKLFKESRESGHPTDFRLQRLHAVLFYNSQNRLALREGWKVLNEFPDLTWAQLPKSAQVFLAEAFCDLLICLKTTDKKSMRDVLEIAVQAPDWPWAKLIPGEERARAMSLAQEIELEGQHREAKMILHLISLAVEADQSGGGDTGSKLNGGAGRDVQRRQSVA